MQCYTVLLDTALREFEVPAEWHSHDWTPGGSDEYAQGRTLAANSFAFRSASPTDTNGLSLNRQTCPEFIGPDQ